LRGWEFDELRRNVIGEPHSIGGEEELMPFCSHGRRIDGEDDRVSTPASYLKGGRFVEGEVHMMALAFIQAIRADGR
jgi:hypothetical protein